MSPEGSAEPPLPPTTLPEEREVVKDRAEGPLAPHDEFFPPEAEVRAPRSGPPQMPTPPTLQPDEIRAARQGAPSMPSFHQAEPDEVRAARQGAPSMPSMPQIQPDEVRPARQGPPSMPTWASPHADEIRAPRQGPPRMPTLSPSPEPHEVRAARQGPPQMPRIAESRADEVRADRRQGQNGTPPVSVPREFEVRQDHAEHTDLPPLPLDPGRVEIEAEGMRRKVRVMTTGVFDLLHLGHVHMLEAARRLGDELYVVIARDETVRRMKHEPLNGEEIRRQIVENLKPVTKAVLGHVGDIYRTVQDVRPDVIALGYDQKFTEDEVRRRSQEHGVNVRVVRLPQFDHDLDATRKIIERIGDRIAKKELYTQREG